MGKTLKVSKKRNVNTYASLKHASWCLLDVGKKYNEGSFYQFLASIVFSAFSFEAFMNHIGIKLFSSWSDIEKKISPIAKCKLICERISLKVDFGKRPFQTIEELFEIRNRIAHARTEVIECEYLISDHPDDEKKKRGWVETKWEKYSNMKNAEKAFEDVKQCITLIHKNSGISDEEFMNQGGQFTSVKILE